MAEAVIGLGSNLGNGPRNVRQAWARLGAAEDIRLLGLSSLYCSAPVGMQTDHWFTNAVGMLETGLAPEQLLALLLRIEEEMGRSRPAEDAPPADRIIDLDLIFYDDLVISSTGLTLPHPEMQDRLFVLVPMAELMPEKRHPVSGLTVNQMLEHCRSLDRQHHLQQVVRRLTWDDMKNPEP